MRRGVDKVGIPRGGTLTSMSGAGTADFFDRLSLRDPPAAWLARELLDAGWSVRSLTGPEQMDVWELLLDRGTCSVRFGLERGSSDGVHVADRAGSYRPITEAMSVSGQPNTILAEEPAVVLQWLMNQSDPSQS